MSSRGFNRGNGKKFWRGGYRAKKFGGKSARNKESTNKVDVCSNQSSNSSLLDQNDVASIQSKIARRPVAYTLKKASPSPYAGWKLYFPNDDYKTSVSIVRKVRSVEDFISRHAELFNDEEIEERRSCIFDLKICCADENFLTCWPSFKDDLFEEPLISLNCLGLGIHQTVWKLMKEKSHVPDEDESQLDIEVPMIQARISNYDTVTQLKNLKTYLYGKLVSVNGTVIRVGNVKLQCSWLAFECVGCSTVQCVKQPDGEFTQPTRCLNKDCNLRTFKPLRSSSYTQTYDWQTIRLQEQVPDDQREGGRVPRTVECELSDDLVSSCAPGDMVTLTGVVKVRCVDQNFKKSKGPSMYTLYLEAVSILNNKSEDCVVGTEKENGMGVQFTQKDYDAIQEIHSEPNLFKLLVHSLCPMIYGHEMVKAGLLLALFGGSFGDAMDSRSQAHVLVVGDPGLGKSQMLQACAFIAPRGVFVCGNTTTSSGLTVTLTREGGGDFALEAGALVLADRGCCCIDEFDKMSTQHQALLEVMEQQTVSIAKAGIICMLPARTTILAAANPAGGHYNKSKTVSENLRMGQALLSRFDLVFILLDQPNEQLDTLLSEHVMKMHSGFSEKSEQRVEHESLSRNSLNTQNILLSDKLKKKHSENLDLIPSQLLRKYIAYSRQYIPLVSLSQEAKKALQDFYLNLRVNYHTMDSTPVTTRQLLSLIRLTQARAKLELREEASLEDALDVIDIVKWSIIDTYSDEYGTLDFHRSQHGSGMSSRNQAKRFLAALHHKSNTLSRSTFFVSEMKEIAKSARIDVANFSSFISTLNTQGFILKKGKDKYQLLSAD